MDVDKEQAVALVNQIGQVVAKAVPLLDSANFLVVNLSKAVDPAQVQKILNDAEKAVAQFNQAATNLVEISENLRTFSERFK